MKLSISVTDYSWPSGTPGLGRELAEVARAADAAGLDTLWVADHLIQAAPGTSRDADMLEAYTTLGYLAACTERVRLGTMVSAVTYRAPAILLKAVTTVDALSGGRAWLGVGAGYHEAEAAAMGLDLPAVGERFLRLEETLQAAFAMWAGDEAPYAGAHVRMERPAAFPAPLTRPHPPILIGGTGERRTLRLVAAYADACNLFDIPDGGVTVRHKLAVLARHCEELGRPWDEIEKTISSRFDPVEDPVQLAERIGRLRELGIDHVVMITDGPWTPQTVERLVAAAGGWA